MLLETERLILREMTRKDLPDLCKMLQDPEVMWAYEHAFSDLEVSVWLERQLERHRENGFGLMAVILKPTGELIGQTGITWQDWNGRQVPEIGYIFSKSHWHQGYATEAASACKQYAFEILGFNEVYSIIRDNNFPSQQVAIRNGMKKLGETIKFYYNMTMPHYVYRITKEENDSNGKEETASAVQSCITPDNGIDNSTLVK